MSVGTTRPDRPAPPGAPAGFGPGAGAAAAPRPAVPLTFLVCGAIGLVGFGFVLAFSADKAAVWPQEPAVVSSAHMGLLVFLTVMVAGALHQFGPVVGVRTLRSESVARLSAVMLFVGALALSSGFGHGPEWLVTAGGATAFVAVGLMAWNLSRPLASRGKGVPLVGLRCAVAFLVLTASFGIVYAIDRQSDWFVLVPHRVLAHAHLGLLGWLGLTYVSVSEKLWPMFLLAHRPRARSGSWAVALLATGTPVLVVGLLFDWETVVIVGAVMVGGGLTAHLVSLAGVVRHRRRKLELLHAFIIAAAASMVAAAVLGAVAGLADVDTLTRGRLVAAEVAAFFGWITLAVVGHAHKIVPFISWSSLRARGIRYHPAGGPLLFAHLFDARVARATFAVATGAVVALVAGMALGSESTLFAAGLSFAGVGVLGGLNLGLGPGRMARAAMQEAGSSPMTTSDAREDT